MNLEFFDSFIRVHIPHKSEKLTHSPQTESSSQSQSLVHSSSSSSLSERNLSLIVPSIHETNIFRSLLPIVTHIQILWELILICEPLIIMAPTPDVVSSLVQSLVSIVYPMKFASDFRPFFTIHDSEFKEYTSRTQAP